MIYRLLLLVLAPLVVIGADMRDTVSVCELIANRIEHSGRMVAVRGRVAAGGHSLYLVADDACSYRLVTRGVTWPNIISVEVPNNKSPDPDARAPFSLSTREERSIDAYFRRISWRDGLSAEEATYVGYFVTYIDLEKRVSPGVPGALLLGFGSIGLGAPGQLLIQRVEEHTGGAEGQSGTVRTRGTHDEVVAGSDKKAVARGRGRLWRFLAAGHLLPPEPRALGVKWSPRPASFRAPTLRIGAGLTLQDASVARGTKLQEKCRCDR